MSKFLNLKIGVRLGAMIAGVLAMMAAIAGTGVWGLNALYGMTRQTLEQDVALAQHAADLQILVLQERRFEKDAFINLADAEKRGAYVKKWKEAASRLEATIDKAKAIASSEEDRKDLDQIGAGYRTYAEGFTGTMSQIEGGSITTTQDANTAIGQAKAAVHAMEKAVDAINQRAMKRAGAVVDVVAGVRDRSATMQVGLSLAGMLLAAMACAYVTRTITRPLSRAVEVAETVAAGDLSGRIDVRYRDEPGQLLAALQRMNTSLVEMVTSVRDASESIATARRRSPWAARTSASAPRNRPATCSRPQPRWRS